MSPMCKEETSFLYCQFDKHNRDGIHFNKIKKININEIIKKILKIV